MVHRTKKNGWGGPDRKSRQLLVAATGGRRGQCPTASPERSKRTVPILGNAGPGQSRCLLQRTKTMQARMPYAATGRGRVPSDVSRDVWPVVSRNRCTMDPCKEGRTTETKSFPPQRPANKRKIRRCPGATREIADSIPTKHTAVEDPPPCHGSAHDGSARMNPPDKHSVRLFTRRWAKRRACSSTKPPIGTCTFLGCWHQRHHCSCSKWTLLLARV